MEIKAHAKFLKLSPRKARLLLSNIRGKKALDAVALLGLSPQKAGREIIKILNTALANAHHNFGLSKNDLYIKEIQANQGPTFKRYKPRARGSADVIRKKMTHLSVILAPIEGAKKAELKEINKIEKAKKEALNKRPVVKKEAVKEETPVSEIKKTTKKEKEIKQEKAPVAKETAKTEEEPQREENKKEPVKKSASKKAQPIEKSRQEKFTKKNDGFMGGLKRFFRRKGF